MWCFRHIRIKILPFVSKASESCANFRLVGVLTEVVSFLGPTIPRKTNGWSFEMHFLTFFVWIGVKFLFMRCAQLFFLCVFFSSCVSGWLCDLLNDWLHVVVFFIMGDVDMSIVCGFNLLTGVDVFMGIGQNDTHLCRFGIGQR